MQLVGNYLCVAMLFLLPSVSGAADANGGGARSDRLFLEEVVVTATKRAEDVQKVSASVTALGEQSIEMAGIIDPTRLGQVVPGLQVGFSGTEARFAMRGARTNKVGVDAQQVVGIFNDGAYVATVGQVMAAYMDLQRIEVLRGPQGTLYGRNTFAGAVNIISNQPDFEKLSGKADLLYGDYSRVRLEGAFNLPLSSTFAVRIAALGEQHNGYIKNTFLAGPSDDLRNENVKILRVTPRWKPTDSFDATLRFTYYHRDTNLDGPYGYAQIGCYQNNGDPATSTGLAANAVFVKGHCWRPGPDSAASTGPNGDGTGAGVSTLRDVSPYNVARDSPSRNLADGKSFNLQMNYDLGLATLSFIGALDKYRSVVFYDPDSSNGYHYAQFGQDSLNNFFAGYDNDQKDQSYELRLTSNGKTRFQWLAGAYYFKQAADWDFGYLAAGQYTRYGSTHDTYDSKSKAAFGNASFEVVPGLRILGGLRYNKDSQKLIGGADGGGGNKSLWRAGVEYDVADRIMVYATASTGYRVGGVNGSQLVAAGAPAAYGPETVTAYELGLKSQFLDRRLTVNAAVFDNRYRNMQAQSFLTACIDPNNPASCIASEFTSNGGEINSKGLELELDWVPTDSLFVNASASILDAKFGNYLVSRLSGLGNYEGRQDVTRTIGEIVAAGGTPSLQLKGWRPALAPKFSAGLQAGYVFNINEDNTVTPMIQTNYSAKYWSFDYNLPGSEQNAFAKVDARLTWRNKAKGLTVEGFVENLTNKAVLVRSVIFSPGEPNVPTASIQANYGDPRIWGIRVGVDF